MLKINEITRLYLGIQGENKARTLTIDVSAWIALYPNGSVTIWHKRNGESEQTATGAEYDSETQTVTWQPTSTDTYYDGEGEAEFRLTESEVIKKSKNVITGVSPAVTLAGTTLGSDWQSYINAVDGLRADAVTAKEAAEDAEEDAEDSAEDAEAYAIGKRGGTDVESTDPAYHNNSKYWSDKANEMLNVTDVAGAQATTLSAGSSATAEFETGESGKVLKLGIPKGDKGDTGNTGPTPVISIGTVTTGDAGTSASASMDTTDPAHPVLSFTIPKGAKGDSGDGDMLAAAFAEATANDAGTYVTYDGGLYYLPEGHTANVTWANTTKTQVKIGGEVTALKSAIQQKQDAPATAGTAGKVLGLDENLDPAWIDVSVDPSDIAQAVDDWLDDHPEATTTVEDDAITYAKLNSTLKSDVIADSASGMICKFFDGADGIPVDKCKIVFNPTQSGEGEPSSQNIRSFIGFTGSKITHIGKNLLDISQYDKSQTYNEITVDKEHDQLINRKVYADSASRIVFTQQFPAGTYTFYGKIKGSGCDALRFISTAEFANSRWNNSYQGYWVNVENNKLTFTVSTSTQLKLAFKTRSGHANEPATAYEIMFAKGTGNEYSMSWSTQVGTLYGFIADYIAGKVIKTYERIASYNGEELPGVWYSDRDVYEEGTTPTTGAEVVYELSEPVEYMLTGTSINSFLNENNMWSDVEGSIECDYRCSTAEYMKKYVEQEIKPVRNRIIPVNPKMFGAIGDGVTDDSVAMQATFDYAYANNVPIDVSNGVYLIENIVLYNKKKYEVFGHCALETGIEYYHKPVPSIIVKQNSVGFIGNRTSDDNVLSSIPEVFMNMHDVTIKGEDGAILPVCFKDIKFKCSMFTNIVANWFSCFIEGTIGGNSIMSGCKIRNITECVFRSWVDKYNLLSNDPAFTDSNFNHNEFMGITKHNEILYTPTLFEANSFYTNEFSHNFVAVMFAVVGSYESYISTWRSNNNIYSYVPYFALKKYGNAPTNYRLYNSRLENDSIWNQSAFIIHTATEGRSYFDDFNGESRIETDSISFFNFDSIENSTFSGLTLRICESRMLKEVTKFICSDIGVARVHIAVLEPPGPSGYDQVINAENAFNTKIPIDDYEDNTDYYLHTHIESWNGRTETILPTIEDNDYRYVLDGQTCYYNNKLLICHGSNWYDAMGNVVS